MTDPRLTLDGFHHEFADLAERIAHDRQRGYPAMVDRGELSESQARHRIFVMYAVAEIWRCAADNLMPQKRFHALTQAQALDELDGAIEGARKRLNRKPADPQRQLLLDQLRAMRWWHGHYKPAAYVLNMALMLRHDALRRAAQAEPGKAAA